MNRKYPESHPKYDFGNFQFRSNIAKNIMNHNKDEFTNIPNSEKIHRISPIYDLHDFFIRKFGIRNFSEFCLVINNDL